MRPPQHGQGYEDKATPKNYCSICEPLRGVSTEVNRALRDSINFGRRLTGPHCHPHSRHRRIAGAAPGRGAIDGLGRCFRPGRHWRTGRNGGCDVRVKCRRKPCGTGTSAGLFCGGDGLGFDLACTRPDTPAPGPPTGCGARSPVPWTGLDAQSGGLWAGGGLGRSRGRQIAAGGRLCPGRVWTGWRGRLWGRGGLGPVFVWLPGVPALCGHPCGLPVLPLPAAPGLPVGCRSRLPGPEGPRLAV